MRGVAIKEKLMIMYDDESSTDKAVTYYERAITIQQLASRVPAWIKELGEDGNHVLADTFWAPGLPYPGNKEINEGAKRQLGLPQPPDFFGQGY